MSIYGIKGSCKAFNPFPSKLIFFRCLQYKSFENTVEKGEIARNEQFPVFPQCFLPVWVTLCHFPYNLQLSPTNSFSFGSLKSVVRERVNLSLC